MAIYTAMAIKHGTVLYFLCRGMRLVCPESYSVSAIDVLSVQPDHEGVKNCVFSVIESLGRLTTGGSLFTAMYPLWDVEVLGVVLTHPIYTQYRDTLRHKAVNELRANSKNSVRISIRI
jgi:hypothetical protein